MYQFHPYHMVFYSPWPITMGLTSLITMMSLVGWFHNSFLLFWQLIVVLTIIIVSQWWRDVCRESAKQGFHSTFVISNMRWGMILFIVSEIMFFFSFFWAFFHSSLAPNVELGSVWPPLGIDAINPFQVPLLNTVILLSSGVTVTWSHHAIISKDMIAAKLSLLVTVLLGFYFTLLQGWEYFDSSFSIADSSYGSTFFIATGFHGLHVIIGSLFLLVGLMRIVSNNFSGYHHIGFESAIWYWHFVDVVWLFLFSFIYWWAY
uniref:Cytochrome c oxidase subunit 3 n=1 Tax=Batillipes longispinosus TaxID=1477119 RepID=A0A0K0KA12_9BILA|nr:cytochrome c oxidase subunit III [Batillipes longispinosus]